MDQRWDDAMALALDMAAKSPCPDPNPRVGCVIVAEDRVIGQGWHRGAGTPHAEVEAPVSYTHLTLPTSDLV